MRRKLAAIAVTLALAMGLLAAPVAAIDFYYNGATHAQCSSDPFALRVYENSSSSNAGGDDSMMFCLDLGFALDIPDMRNITYQADTTGDTCNPGTGRNWDNCISSLFVYSGMKVCLYSGYSYAGYLTSLQGGFYNMLAAWNDKVSSMKIIGIGNPC